MNPVLAWFETLTLVLLAVLLWPVAEVLMAYSLEKSVVRLRPGRGPWFRSVRRRDRLPGGWLEGRPDVRRSE